MSAIYFQINLSMTLIGSEALPVSYFLGEKLDM